jgi:hypothetical protein
LERDEQIAEWIELADKPSQNADIVVFPQLAEKLREGRPESGVNKAARELGIDSDDAYRATKVASLSTEAKEAARELGLDDNRSALLKVAAKPQEQQADAVRKIAEAKADEAKRRRRKCRQCRQGCAKIPAHCQYYPSPRDGEERD